MAYKNVRCYYHNRCEDRPAVAFCSKCGKGLCRECAENLKSEDTGKILCVDCLNEEMAEDVAWATYRKKSVKKELKFIIAGAIIGAIIGLPITLFSLLLLSSGDKSAAILFGPAMVTPMLFASFGTIIKLVWKIRFGDGFISRLISFAICLAFFAILCAASPIIFIWRVVRRAKDIKLLKRFAALQTIKYNANNRYAELASKMVTTMTTEEFERDMAIKYADLRKTDKEAADKLIEEERKKNEAQAEENKRLRVEEKQLVRERDDARNGMVELQAKYDKQNKDLENANRRGRKESRSDDIVD